MTHDKLVEEVAREIWQANPIFEGLSWARTADTNREAARKMARAAIAHIAARTKEATEEMLKIWTHNSRPKTAEAWSTMHRASALWPTAPAKGGER